MIISLTGPSGIGKGFIKGQLLCVYPFLRELVWLTTRPLRPNEKHGNRIQVSTPEFDGLAQTGKLVLVQNLYGYSYGLKREDLLPSPSFSITELHPDNIKAAFEINPNIIAIGFVTRDLSLLRHRLSVVRNTESAPEIERRVAAAKVEIDTVTRNSSLFAAVIEVSKFSGSSTFDQVLAALAPHLPRKESGHVA